MLDCRCAAAPGIGIARSLARSLTRTGSGSNQSIFQRAERVQPRNCLHVSAGLSQRPTPVPVPVPVRTERRQERHIHLRNDGLRRSQSRQGPWPIPTNLRFPGTDSHLPATERVNQICLCQARRMKERHLPFLYLICGFAKTSTITTTITLPGPRQSLAK